MIKKKQQFALRLIALGGLLALAAESPAMAASHTVSLAGYALDSGGDIVMSGYGECWRTARWHSGNRPVACGGKPPQPAAPPAMAEPPAPPPITQTPPAEHKPLVIVRAIDMGRVNFGFDRSTLSQTARGTLDKVAIKLRMDDGIEGIEITGHTDNIGSEAYNQRLSLKRARSVADYLANKGVSRDLMSISGKGETAPVANNATREGRALNRRTQIWVRRKTTITPE